MDRRAIPRLATSRPVTVIVGLVACLVVGGMAYSRIPLELLPGGLQAPFLFVRVSYPNASPEEVLDQVTRPVEEALQAVKGVERMRTSSGPNGMWSFVEFRPDTDMGLAYVHARDRLDRVTPRLPEDADRIRVFRWNPNDTPIMAVVMTFGSSVDDPSPRVEEVIRPRLERIPGVASTEVSGVYEPDVRVWLDPDRLREHGIGLFDLRERLRRASFTMGSGTIRVDGRRTWVRSDAELADMEALEDLPVGPSGPRGQGPSLTLGDLGQVSYGIHSVSHVYRVDGLPAASIELHKTSEANAVDVCRRVREVLEGELPADDRLADVAFHPIWDQGEVIEGSIGDVLRTALWGGILAVLVLFAFLRRPTMTAMVALSIPLSLTITLVAMYFRGSTLNVLTLMGLMLAIGMLVDNSIVVVEAIDRRRAEGGEALRAAIDGSGEVGLAILISTATTLVVFIPLSLMQSRFQQFMAAIGTPVCIALAASLFVALVVIPLAASRLGKRRDPDDEGEEATGPGTGGRFEDGYARVLRLALDHRLATVLLAVGLCATAWYPWSEVDRTFTMEGGVRRVDVSFRFPTSYGLPEANDAMERIEGALVPAREEFGAEHVRVRFDAEEGRVTAYLEPPTEESPSPREVIAAMKERIPDIPGVVFDLGWRSRDEAGSAVEYVIRGDEPSVLADLATEARRRLRSVEGIESVDLGEGTSPPELLVQVQRDRAERYGVPSEVAVWSVASALRGSEIPSLRLGGREVDVRLALHPEERETTDQLAELPVRSGQSALPLDRIASFRRVTGAGSIRREDGRTQISVTGRTTSDDVLALYERADRALAGMTLPPGFELGRGRSFRELQDASDDGTFATALAAACVFLLMGMLFESVLLPFSIILAIPFALTGVYWGLWATGSPFDVMSGIGVVILVGIVVNNGVVLVDAIHLRRGQGLSRREAILSGARARVRPILMTAVTTIVGLLPMALGDSNLVNVPYQPLGRTVIGGLVAATVLTLFIIPTAYTLVDDLGGLLRTVLATLASPLRGGRETRKQEEPTGVS